MLWSQVHADFLLFREDLDRAAAARQLLPALGELPIQRLDAATLDHFYDQLRRHGGPGGTALSTSTVRKIQTVLSGALKLAEELARPATPDLPTTGDAGGSASPMSGLSEQDRQLLHGGLTTPLPTEQDQQLLHGNLRSTATEQSPETQTQAPTRLRRLWQRAQFAIVVGAVTLLYLAMWGMCGGPQCPASMPPVAPTGLLPPASTPG